MEGEPQGGFYTIKSLTDFSIFDLFHLLYSNQLQKLHHIVRLWPEVEDCDIFLFVFWGTPKSELECTGDCIQDYPLHSVSSSSLSHFLKAIFVLKEVGGRLHKTDIIDIWE